LIFCCEAAANASSATPPLFPPPQPPTPTPTITFTPHNAPQNPTPQTPTPTPNPTPKTNQTGFIEYWSGTTFKHPPAATTFSLKMDTDLFALAQSKTVGRSLAISKDGSQFAMFCADGRVRVWRVKTGKLRRIYDESLEVGGVGLVVGVGVGGRGCRGWGCQLSTHPILGKPTMPNFN